MKSNILMNICKKVIKLNQTKWVTTISLYARDRYTKHNTMNSCYPLSKENRVVSCVLKGYSSAPCMPPVVNWSQCTVYTVASGQRRIRKSCSSSLIRDACKSDFHSVQICFIAIRKWFHLYNFFGQLTFNYNGLRFHYFYFTPTAAHELYNMSSSRGRRGRDRMAVRFTYTYAISTYHH
jgi:hypothetical protein